VRGRRSGQRHDHRAPVLSAAPSSVVVQGRELTFPIEVRAARSWAAQFLVDPAAAQKLIDHSGLRIARVFGRGLLTLAFVRYDDSDLGSYNEFGVIFLVGARRGFGVYVHRLPVNKEFTLAAGREIWGYPKTMADIDIDERGRTTACSLKVDGADVLELTVRRGVLPAPQPTLPTYTNLNGVLRVTSWQMQGRARMRLGGAKTRLGKHPIAEELYDVGLPKGALAVSTVEQYRASFGPARVLSPAKRV
jgi:hypothetical protein